MPARKKLRIAFTFLAAPFLVVLYFNIENLAARLGWANLLADAVAPERGDRPVVDFLQHPATLWVALISLGFCAGLWVDMVLARKERQPLIDEALEQRLDRNKIADEAEQLARSISKLAGEGEGRVSVGWNEDEAKPVGERQQNFGTPLAHSVRERAFFIAQYGEKHHADVCRVIDAARRFVTLDRDDLRTMDNVMTGGYGIGQLPALLMKIANALRFPNDGPMPVTDRLLAILAEGKVSPPPLGTGQETQP